MEERYRPKYAKGQIIVLFKDFMQTEIGPISIDRNKYYRMKEEIIRNLGYELLEQELEFEGGYDLIKVPEGQEWAAVKRIRGHKNFFQGADRRDMTWENRQEALEDLEEKVTDLDDACSLMPRGEYLRTIDEIAELVEKAKKAA